MEADASNNNMKKVDSTIVRCDGGTADKLALKFGFLVR